LRQHAGTEIGKLADLNRQLAETIRSRPARFLGTFLPSEIVQTLEPAAGNN
jgi:hypothetical protein